MQRCDRFVRRERFGRRSFVSCFHHRFVWPIICRAAFFSSDDLWEVLQHRLPFSDVFVEIISQGVENLSIGRRARLRRDVGGRSRIAAMWSIQADDIGRVLLVTSGLATPTQVGSNLFRHGDQQTGDQTRTGNQSRDE